MAGVSNEPLTPEQIQRLREGLARRGWIQTDLARHLDMRDSTISDIFLSKTGPRTSTFRAICDALEINPGYVMLGIDPKWVAARASSSSTELRPVAVPALGVERWFGESVEGRTLGEEERESMRRVPWPDPHARYPDVVYHLVLSGLRQARQFHFPSAGNGH